MSTEPTLKDAADAIEEVAYRFDMLTQPNSDLVNRAEHLLKLSDAIGDLKSWHPEYDSNHGTLPYEREDLENNHE